MTRTGIQLHLLRHADAGDPAAWRGDDADRPLSDKGYQQAERLALHLALAGFEPDAVVSSPKVRALQTAEIVAAALGIEVRVDDRLGETLSIPGVEAILRDAGDVARPVLVGHDPDFSELLSSLADARLEMKKGALARIDLPDGLRAGGARLRWLLPPDLLPAEV
jgi:phosphohistidine phosphatase SixA